MTRVIGSALSRLAFRWLAIFKPRTLCVVAGGIALVYFAATIASYARVLGDDPLANGDGLISGDYAAFYAAGQLVLRGDMRHLYDAAPVRALQEAAINGRVPDFYVAYRNPPFFAPLFAPLASIDLIPSFVVWTVCSIGLFALALTLAIKAVPVMRPYWKYTVLVVAGFCPVYSGLVDGQNATLSLLLYVLIYRALRRGKDGQAGGWAALGLFKPQLFFILPVVFAASRRWRALATYSSIAGVLALLSLGIVGPDGLGSFTRIIVGFEPGNAVKLAGRMYSLKAFFDLLLPGQTGVAFGLSLVFSAVLLVLLIRVWRPSNGFSQDFDARWVLTMLIALLVDPHLLDYDLTVLILPGLLLASSLADGPWWIAVVFVITLIDVPLSVGPMTLQLGVVILVALAARVWLHLERRTEHAPSTSTVSVWTDITRRGVACAASS